MFVTTHVKTPTRDALINEMAVVHSLAEASVQPAGSLEQTSAASGTEGAAATIGVRFSPSAPPLYGQSMGEIDMINSLRDEDQRNALTLSYLRDKQEERKHEQCGDHESRRLMPPVRGPDLVVLAGVRPGRDRGVLAVALAPPLRHLTSKEGCLRGR